MPPGDLADSSQGFAMNVLAPGLRPLPILLCLSHLRWNHVFQRPQHLMTLASASYRVIFFEEPVFEPGTEPSLRAALSPEGVLIATPVLPHGLDAAAIGTAQRTLLDGMLDAQEQPLAVIWYYTPMALDFAGHLQAPVTVFDSMDELSAFAGAPPRLGQMERRLLQQSDLVFTGGRSLFKAKRDRHPSVHLFPSSVDTAHFAAAREPGITDPQDQAGIPHPRIGFFGVIDERMDLALLAAVAAARPDWHLVVLGPIAKIDPASLPRRANLHWLGQKSYAELPGYLAHWQVGMMPFALNEATRYISPTKTPEFLAAGIPVVSTSVPDVVADWGQDGLVEVADGTAAFIAAIERLLVQPGATWLAQVDARLATISWRATWDRMHALITETAAARSDEPRHYDWLVVGAGFAGSVLAERLASERGERVLVIDRRDHIAGNAYDHLDAAGVLVHRYGPHIFHTNSQPVADYLSRFTAWRPYEHRVLGQVDGQLVPIPINLDTVNSLYGLDLTSEELEDWFGARAEQVDEIRTSEDVIVARIGRELYKKFFQGYTRKQWGLDPSELDRTVTARVPVRTNRDDRYFTDSFQAMPRDGYTPMFARMLDHPNIDVMLGLEHRDLPDSITYGRLIWTGQIDEFFGYRFGKLPYRSLQFRHENLPMEQFQSVGTVNHPQDQDYTRVSEYKHMTGQVHPTTSVTYEYPTADGDPYYPVPRPENQALYKRYEALADAQPATVFVGRLATYRYLNMDQVVAQALATFRRIEQETPAGCDKTATASARGLAGVGPV